MDIQFAKYKELIEQQLEELTAEDVLGQSAQKTVELDQQSVTGLGWPDIVNIFFVLTSKVCIKLKISLLHNAIQGPLRLQILIL